MKNEREFQNILKSLIKVEEKKLEEQKKMNEELRGINTQIENLGRLIE